MAKVSLTKLKLETKYDETRILKWNNEEIIVKMRLPMKEKLALITKIVNEVLDDNDFCNQCRFKIFFTIETIAAYTNINITDKQREDVYKLYDMIVNSGLWTEFYKLYSDDEKYYELNFVEMMSNMTLEQMYAHRCSAAGIMESLVDNYGKAKIDIEKLSEDVKQNLNGSEENMAFLKEVLEKLG